MDAWLYETCTQCLQHMVDIVALFYKPVAPILPRILDLLSNFIRCSTLTLAGTSSPAMPEWHAKEPLQLPIGCQHSKVPHTCVLSLLAGACRGVPRAWMHV